MNRLELGLKKIRIFIRNGRIIASCKDLRKIGFDICPLKQVSLERSCSNCYCG